MKEGIPLINTVGLEPGEPPWMTFTPAALPCKASSVLTALIFSISALLIVEIAPDTFVIFWEPYPTTITSSKLFELLSSKRKSVLLEAFTNRSIEVIPTKETTKLAPLVGILITN